MMVEVAEALPVAGLRVLADWSLLSVDVQTNPSDNDRFFMVGLIRCESDRGLSLPTGRVSPAAVTNRDNAMTDGAPFLGGHNLRQHDVPNLSAIALRANLFHRLSRPTPTTCSSMATSRSRTRAMIPRGMRGQSIWF
jgi:hypothetical protein